MWPLHVRTCPTSTQLLPGSDPSQVTAGLFDKPRGAAGALGRPARFRGQAGGGGSDTPGDVGRGATAVGREQGEAPATDAFSVCWESAGHLDCAFCEDQNSAKRNNNNNKELQGPEHF